MDRKNRIIILGAGGHARSLIDVLRTQNGTEVIGILNADKSRNGANVDGIPIIGQDNQLESFKSRFDFFLIGVGSSGTHNQQRMELYRHCMGLGLLPYSAISKMSIISTSAILGDGAQIFHSAVVNAGSKIGEHVIINTSAVIEHDCTIGDHSHIATAATLAGGVTVGKDVFIGSSAVVIPGIKIGDRAIIGAGAVVNKNVASGAKIVGNPGRQIP
jgi:sugar O-acyltransferase (sialic acid O-acetyltransferase NeuD family)